MYFERAKAEHKDRQFQEEDQREDLVVEVNKIVRTFGSNSAFGGEEKHEANFACSEQGDLLDLEG